MDEKTRDRKREECRRFYERNREKMQLRSRAQYYENEEYRKNKNAKVKQRVYEDGAIRFIKLLYL